MKLKLAFTAVMTVSTLALMMATFLNSKALSVPGTSDAILPTPLRTGPLLDAPLAPSVSLTPEQQVLALPSWDEFYSFIETVTPCDKQTKFGGARHNPKNDGAKMVCLDEGFTLRPGSCTVLSFGINNEWSFDDAIESSGCKVYAFDPSMKAGDHVRRKNIHFFKLGISDSRKTISVENTSWQLDSYRGILKKINKTNTIIDYLKIDVEGAELDFFADVLYEDAALLENVKQIGMEIHPGKNATTRDRLWKYMHQIQTLNFRLIFSELNTYVGSIFQYNNKRVSKAFELAWINENFKSRGKNT